MLSSLLSMLKPMPAVKLYLRDRVAQPTPDRTLMGRELTSTLSLWIMSVSESKGGDGSYRRTRSSTSVLRLVGQW